MGRKVMNSYMRFMNQYKREHPEIELLSERQQGDVIAAAYRESTKNRKRSPQRRRSQSPKLSRRRPRSLSPRKRSSRK